MPNSTRLVVHCIQSRIFYYLKVYKTGQPNYLESRQHQIFLDLQQLSHDYEHEVEPPRHGNVISGNCRRNGRGFISNRRGGRGGDGEQSAAPGIGNIATNATSAVAIDKGSGGDFAMTTERRVECPEKIVQGAEKEGKLRIGFGGGRKRKRN